MKFASDSPQFSYVELMLIEFFETTFSFSEVQNSNLKPLS
ncbi:hypothetical protein LEP1GSC074_2280 [Leptospira noguchii str. Hook]|uniref:Uncharacterized protein n=1 Tax=Leptospira noguchii serovar Autumnalis str. ZUN142 TaxID=1085540 RepID=M6UUK8_9LEPT|nr:hypothetical protein LEP1GSC170_3985 [Leptospira interrogans serovar Bataviae str. HAI135]EMO40953.1 hypothetical protein LEP1GSC186_4433 [Leptospira noguchii serovar Autumnalis str. ZUN142]EMS87308.1 hypothetical protein LEP1GSC074_2280 [Leptospira noguchii str. Hook]